MTPPVAIHLAWEGSKPLRLAEVNGLQAFAQPGESAAEANGSARALVTIQIPKES